jgi:radical SAM protein with 4Fe4S-binding SPASM domain
MQEASYIGFCDKLKEDIKDRRPLKGHIELTYSCNLDCVHCYCKGRQGRRDELTVRQWRDIIDQLRKENCLWLYFTGGEPFSRPDFLDIYAYAKDKGFLVVIFTNGTIIGPKILKFLKNRPPFLIEIPLYGATKRIHESVTQTPGSFQKARENINKLLQLRIPLVIKTVGMKQNKKEILKIKALSERLLGKRRFKFDSFVLPRTDGDITPCRYRLSPSEILEIENSDQDMLDQRQEELKKPNNFARPKEYLYHCNTWWTNFFVNPYGLLQFCNLTEKFAVRLTEKSFKQGFYHEFPKLSMEKFSTDSKCMSCGLRKICCYCPARALLETGDEESPVEYFCRLAEARRKTI